MTSSTSASSSSITAKTFNDSINHQFTKALPSPSPVVTPEMGERLCRMSSQHHQSDYNRYKRGHHHHQQQQHQQQQQQHLNNQQSNQPIKQHRHRHHHHHQQQQHHQQQEQQQASTGYEQSQQSQEQREQQPEQQYQQHEISPLTTRPEVLNQLPNLTPNQHDQSQHSITHPISTINPNSITASTNQNQNHHPIPVGAPQPTPPDPLTGTPSIQPYNPGLTLPPPETTFPLDQHHQPNDFVDPSDGNQNSSAAPAKVYSIKTSQSHPMNISPVIPPELTPALGFMLKSANNLTSANNLPIDLFDLTGSESAKATQLFWQHCHQRKLSTSTQPVTDPSLPDPTRQHDQFPQDIKLGNLLLSSCPGKKVRMDETPAQRRASGNHRSPICRDLKSDLSRAHSIGIRAIICCLDDQELEYLGSPWPEYHKTSVECGLKVIRIPIAEGFAPQRGIEEINEVLDQVVESYTLNGIDVLCHCRGGVGRAGLVACCWMLKIGLINKPIFISDSNGQVSYDHHHFGQSNSQDQYQFQHLRHQSNADSAAHVQDVLSIIDGQQLIPKNSVLGQVEKVIEVIRRRRSAKAIETPQQVHFIIQYADWLDNFKAQDDTDRHHNPSLPSPPFHQH